MAVPLKVGHGGNMVFDSALAYEWIHERDGEGCSFPGCEHGFTENSGSPWFRTIDHIYPRSLGKLDGWTWEEIWDISNLAKMHRVCNQRKGDTPYNADGTLTLVEYTRSVKIVRPDVCSLCYAGRLLTKGEECPDCGLGPQPTTWPAYLQKDPRECAHDRTSHCKFCVPGFTERLEPLAL